MEPLQIGDAVVAQVHDPGFELVLPSTGPTAALVEAHRSWLDPHYVTEDGSLRIGSSIVAIRSQGTTIVVDPWLAFDDPDGSSPEATARLTGKLTALAEAGFEAEDVDVVINTHVDGSGANTRPSADGDRPTFPKARYLLHQAELDLLDAGRHSPAVTRAWRGLRDAAMVDAFSDPFEVTGEVQLEPTSDHSPGHTVVHVRSGDASAVVVGHLFLHPLQLHAVGSTDAEEHPDAVVASRRRLLGDAAVTGSALVGPLFAAPGAGRVEADGEVWRLALLR